MPHWVEPLALLRIVQRDVSIRGDEAPTDAILREPALLIPLSAPGTPPLDVHTYRARRDRWEAGDGPHLTGMRQFMEVLESLETPARAVVVEGHRTTYVFLLDPAVSRVLASVAIDPP
jgi:hypothetical protein